MISLLFNLGLLTQFILEKSHGLNKPKTSGVGQMVEGTPPQNLPLRV